MSEKMYLFDMDCDVYTLMSTERCLMIQRTQSISHGCALKLFSRGCRKSHITLYVRVSKTSLSAGTCHDSTIKSSWSRLWGVFYIHNLSSGRSGSAETLIFNSLQKSKCLRASGECCSTWLTDWKFHLEILTKAHRRRAAHINDCFTEHEILAHCSNIM